MNRIPIFDSRLQRLLGDVCLYSFDTETSCGRVFQSGPYSLEAATDRTDPLYNQLESVDDCGMESAKRHIVPCPRFWGDWMQLVCSLLSTANQST